MRGSGGSKFYIYMASWSVFTLGLLILGAMLLNCHCISSLLRLSLCPTREKHLMYWHELNEGLQMTSNLPG